MQPPLLFEQSGSFQQVLRERTGCDSADIGAAAIGPNRRIETEIALRGGAWAGSHRLILAKASEDGTVIENEYQLRRAAYAAGVTTGEPLWLGHIADGADGQLGFLVRAIPADGHLDQRRHELSAEAGDAIVYGVGQDIARLHAITSSSRPADLGFLPVPGEYWAPEMASLMRIQLDRHGIADPVLEWAINWMVDHAPPIDNPVLVHGDLRAVHLLVDGEALAAIEGLENARWSDRWEDLGWFCARFWRGGAFEREAGGIGSREAFLDGYRDQTGGGSIDEERVAFWEIYAALRAGVDHIAGCGSSANPAAESEPSELKRLRALEAEYDLVMQIGQHS